MRKVKPIIMLSLSLCITVSCFASESLCNTYKGIPKDKSVTAGMVLIKGGTFIMGNNKGHKDKTTGNHEPFLEERYEHQVVLDDFWIDKHEVTNAQFTKFVDATGYVTLVERKPKKEWFPANFPEEKIIAGSAVFFSPKKISSLNNITQWWQFIPGANWRQPQGLGSTINDKMNHPVVHIAYEDALAYAQWMGHTLPTEAQWEYAAKGDLSKQPYTWGNTYKVNGKFMANTWQGKFPLNNTKEDGYIGTAPVGCFHANGYGLFDMAGNVWEIVKDNYKHRHPRNKTKNPIGPLRSFDPRDPDTSKHVIKGGSYLCTPMYCMRYRPSARQGQDDTLGTSHIGFRTVFNQ